MSASNPEALKSKKSRIISTVLSPALRLWLRSQVEDVEALQFNIIGGDRQILTGHIPRVAISASRAVYQGLHLRQIQLEGSDIRVNLPQVIKGKPLRLLEPVPVAGQLLLLESDLQASLQSPLLSTGLTELLTTLLKADGITNPIEATNNQQINWKKISIEAGEFTLFGELTDNADQTTPIMIHAGLQLLTPHELQLSPVQLQIHPDKPLLNLDRFQVDLGPDVDIEELTLTPGQLVCRGGLSVIP